MGKTEVTKLAIMRAAEQLFAERGVDNVSLREVAVAAGQGNHSAVVYHFGDKRALVEAMLARHSAGIDASYPQALAQLRSEGRESLRELVRLLVDPLVGKLDDEDGGPQYVLICSQLVHSRTLPMTSMRAANGPGAMALTQRMLQYMGSLSPLLLPIKAQRLALVLFGSIVSYQRLTTAGLFIPRGEFSEDLIDALVAICITKPGVDSAPKSP